MADKLQFGIAVTPTAGDVAGMTALAHDADEAGLDLIAVQDHPYQPGHLDTVTALAHLGALTTRVRLLTDVADMALRPVPMLAKAAASLDVLTRGRFELGAGSGGFPDAVAAMGGNAVRGGAAVEFTAEALRLLRAALDAEGPIAMDGRHHRIGGYEPGPAPAHRVPVWLGAQGPRMLGLIGELADGWISPLNVYVPPAEVPAKQDLIDDAAARAGRDPARVRRLYNVLGLIGGSHRGKGLFGSAETWAQTLAGWAQGLRFDTFVFWPAMAERDQLQRFAQEVVPRVRELTE
ncbi:LLM class flavin-dependent oxidoreductase [Catellatospora sichuanensis]|uniref:LLM class flavin-dependent oxidoreductase n=1 Tax=Catellatospora sichuanensis TaxID=1969805 RepID=UPI00118209E9|nr:LLM class flavin-dependent oxidoreductase [Catellatospora sichuanensis]